MYVKTDLDLDPSDKDKINQCIKYWVCELGDTNVCTSMSVKVYSRKFFCFKVFSKNKSY